MWSRKLRSVVLLSALLAATCVGAVSAQTAEPAVEQDPDVVSVRLLVERLVSAGDDAEAMWATLPSEAKEAVLQFSKVTKIEVGQPVVTESGTQTEAISCKEVSAPACGSNVFGVTVWCYWQSINWCYDGQWITSVQSRNRWVEIRAPFWSFLGHIGEGQTGGAGFNIYNAWTQGHFQYCLTDLGCIQNQYPRIDQTVTGGRRLDGELLTCAINGTKRKCLAEILI